MPRAALLLLLAAAGIAACTAAATPKARSIQAVIHRKNSVVPITKNLKNFKTGTTAVTNTLNTAAVDKSYAMYRQLIGGKPVTKPAAAVLNNYKANLKKIMGWNNAGKTLKHVYGPNFMTELTVQQRAKYFGLRKKGKSYAQFLEEQVAMLRRTSRISGEQMERAAQAMEAARLADADEVSAAQAQSLDGIPDWSTVLPTPKNQGVCGSCWAHAAATMIEAASYAKKSQAISLSEQDLVDCDTTESACDGGWPHQAMQWVVENGITSSSLYEYKGVQQACPAERKPVSRLESVEALPVNNEPAMLEALKDGPISVAIMVDDPMMYYSGGVYRSSTCGGSPNHAVVVVGAGVDQGTNEPYWLVRNSWGTGWGEGGYIRIARGLKAGSPGMCGIATYVYQAVSADRPDGANDDNTSGGDAPSPPPGPSPPSPPGPSPPPSDGSGDEEYYYYGEEGNNEYGYSYGDTDDPYYYTDYSECEKTTLVCEPDTNIAYTAEYYNSTAAQVQINNELSWDIEIESGQEITIDCPTNDTWSPLFGYDGYYEGELAHNGLVIEPQVLTCPDGEYVVQMHAIPSQWGFDDGSIATWLGTINMLCSDGTELTLDAQPDFNPGWSEGTLRSTNGFDSISVYATSAVESLFGVGGQNGVNEQIWSCPPGTIITGMSGGASPNVPEEYLDPLQSYIEAFQLRCSMPFEYEGKLKNMLKAKFPDVPKGLACDVATSAKGETFMTAALRLKVDFAALMTSNPGVVPAANGVLPAGSKLFLPPCMDGWVEGTKVSRSAAVAMRVPRPKKGQSVKDVMKMARRADVVDSPL